MPSHIHNSTLLNRIPKETNILYHYTTRSAALEYILSSGKLRLSPLEFANDPRESKHWLCNLSAPVETAFDDNYYVKTIDELNLRLKRYCRMVSFATDSNEIPLDHNGRNGYSHSRMWAQYAEKQSGVCILFNKNKVEQALRREMANLGENWTDLISYDLSSIEDWNKDSPEVVLTSTQLIDDFIKSNGHDFLFRKRIDWRDEHEFRIVIYSSSKIGENLYLPIEDAICGLILGVDFPTCYFPSVIEICKKWKVSADHLQWMVGTPFLSHPVYDLESEQK